MRAIWIIFRRELAAYFTSPIAYLIGAGFLILTGVSFNNDLRFALSVRPVDPALIPNILAQFMILFAPLLTMRLLAEEAREGTLELLLTAPISNSAIVIGKFFSAWGFFTLLLSLTWIYQIILGNFSNPDLAHTVSAYLGIWLYAGATLAIGVVFSSSTENQILAAFLSLITLFLLYYGEGVGQLVTNAELARIVFNITLLGHFAPSFAVGVIRGEDIIYYAGTIVLALFIAMQFIAARRRQVQRDPVALLSIAFLVGIVSLTYIMVQRAVIVVDMTLDSRFTLSAQSLEVINAAQRSPAPIQILSFYRPQDTLQREIDDQYWQLYEQASQGRITRRYVNPVAEPAFFARYQQAFEQGVYTFIGYTNDQGILDESTLIPVSNDTGQEEDMSEALAQLLVRGQFTVYFERSLETLDPEDNGQQGMSILNSILRTNGIVTQPLSFQDLIARNQEIPQDASALILARPQRRLTPTERALLDRYLQAGGAVFIAADFTPTADAFLSESDPFNADLWQNYGLRMLDAVVVDPLASGQTALDILSAAVVGEDNQITYNLNQPDDPNSAVQFRLARAIEVNANPPISNGASIQSSPQSWGERNYADLIQRNTYVYDEGTDLAPALTTVAWANDETTGMKLVLVGDADFLTNGQARQPQGNATLFLNSIGWLTGFAQQVAFEPRIYTTTPVLFVSGQDLNLILIGTLVVLPAVLIVGAILAYLRRFRQ